MGYIGSLIFYITSFSLSGFLFYIGSLNKKNSFNIVSIIALIIPICIATFRYGVGTDYFSYLNGFYRAESYSIYNNFIDNGIFESGFYIITKIAIVMGNYRSMFALSSILTLVPIYYVFSKHRGIESVTLGMILYLCIYFPTSLNIMRQYIALAFVVLSFDFIFKRQFIKFVITILIASLFHKTAIIVLLLYFLWSKNNEIFNILKMCVAIFLLIFIAIYYIDFLEILSSINGFENYSIYLTNEVSGQNRDIYLKFVVFIMIFLIRKPLIKYDERNKFYLLLLVFDLIISFTGYSSPFIKRFSLYFGIAQLFLLASAPKAFKGKTVKMLIYFLICIYGILYFVLIYYLLGQSDIFPYKLNEGLGY